jgi:hypothetical protein
MDSPILSVTVQAAGFSIASTLLAQGITMYQAQQISWFDPISLLQFMVIAAMMTPPNYLFQKRLEDAFPSKIVKEKEKAATLSIANTAKKFLLDQSFGSLLNTLTFILLVGLFKGKNFDRMMADVQNVRARHPLQEFPLISAGFVAHGQSWVEFLADGVFVKPRGGTI